MNDLILDRWLFESEGDSLDFKREQYRFVGASDNEKSELLKDIIAMVNSWRKMDGYIVIGIADMPDKPNTLIGITEHIDDACLQQFVNSKISGVCRFEYRTFSKNGKTIGIIRVPVQKRPIYLTKDFGKLNANIVYVRRGSSTTEAKPDEVSMMGKDPVETILMPSVELTFYDDLKGKIPDSEIICETTYLAITDKIPKYYSESNDFFRVDKVPQSNYYRDLVDYINFKKSFIPIRFALTNTGEKEAVNLRVEIEIHSINASILLDGDECTAPEKNSMFPIPPRISFRKSSYSADMKIDKWLICNALDRIHAKRTIELDGIVYIQVKNSEDIRISASVYFDGQPAPQQKEFYIKINCHLFQTTWNKFYEIAIKKDGT